MGFAQVLMTLLDMLVFGVALTFVCRHTEHMFQLNYYRYSEQLKWLKKNIESYTGQTTIAVIMLILVILKIDWEIKAVLMLPLLAIACLKTRPKKAKKAFVRTARIKRLEITLSVIYLASCAIPMVLCFNNHQSYIFAVMAGMFFVSPFIPYLANLVNKPVEMLINKHYKDEAKRILRECPDLKIIGITGSYGKTSVKTHLATLLRAKYNVCMTPGNINTAMGVVKIVRTVLKPTDEIFVCEMGAKWVGDIKEICDIVHPDHAVISAIGPQHLESMGSLENIKKTKFELVDSITEGMVFLNGDDENIREHNNRNDAITYSVNGNGDYCADIIETSIKGTKFIVTAPNGEKQEYSTRLIGRHNVLNVVGAIAICHKLGIRLDELKGQVRRLKCVEHRLQPLEKNGVTILDDAYNSNPSGAKAAIETLGMFRDDYKILVTPGMVDLGKEQYELNKQLGCQAAEVCDHVVLVGRRQSVPIKEGLLEKGYSEAKIYVASTIEDALAHVYALTPGEQKHKVILLENDLPDNFI